MELEKEARAFAVIQCNQKAVSCTTYDLAQFIDKRYYEISEIQKTNSKPVRSVESYRLDLWKYDARFYVNSNRHYFKGHVYPNIREHQERFVHHFLNNSISYYAVSFHENPD